MLTSWPRPSYSKLVAWTTPAVSVRASRVRFPFESYVNVVTLPDGLVSEVTSRRLLNAQLVTCPFGSVTLVVLPMPSCVNVVVLPLPSVTLLRLRSAS